MAGDYSEGERGGLILGNKIVAAKAFKVLKTVFLSFFQDACTLTHSATTTKYALTVSWFPAQIPMEKIMNQG